MKTNQHEKKRSGKLKGGAKGDNLWFFLIHNFYSGLFFFIFAYSMWLFDPIVAFSDIITPKFTRLLAGVFVFSILSSVLGWFLGYATWKLIKEQAFHSSVRTMGDLSKGINRFPLTNLAYYLATLLNTLAFSVGALGLIETFLFTNYTFWTLFASYIMLKILIYAIIQTIAEAKL